MRIENTSQWLHLAGNGVMMACFILSGWALPLSTMGLVTMILLLRLCWIEDNLHSDLINNPNLPNQYKNTQIRRAKFFMNFGITPQVETCPRRVASQLRRHSWLLQGIFFGLLAGGLSKLGGVWIIVSLGLVWHGMTRMERNSVGLSWLEKRQALPFSIVAGRVWWLPIISTVSPLEKPDHWQE